MNADSEVIATLAASPEIGAGSTSPS